VIEEVGIVGAVREKRRKERGKVVARERGRGPRRARKKRRERNTGSEVFFGAWQSSA